MSTSIVKAYQTLELETTASFGEVKQAYRLLVKVWHPDRFSGDAKLQKSAETKLQEINLAYELLCAIRDAEVIYQQGVALRNGQGVAKDLTQAAIYLTQAADLGHIDAQILLGFAYQFGDGVAEDEAMAVNYYRKAAMQGSSYAQLYLGICYQDGMGVQKDGVQATEWFRLAAMQGLSSAQQHLGQCYEKGFGVLKNTTEAMKWYRMAAENRDNHVKP